MGMSGVLLYLPAQQPSHLRLHRLVTSITMMVRLLVTNYLPNWPAKAPLAIAAVLVLSMAVGIVALALRRWAGRVILA